jgi:hypothetical protein
MDFAAGACWNATKKELSGLQEKLHVSFLFVHRKHVVYLELQGPPVCLALSANLDKAAGRT